jgi:hypothetical protein
MKKTNSVHNTFKNLIVLDQARNSAKKILKEKYVSVVTPLISVIEMVMKVNSNNHFEAVKHIQDNTNLMETLEKKTLFSAALMEMVEVLDFEGIEN